LVIPHKMCLSYITTFSSKYNIIFMFITVVLIEKLSDIKLKKSAKDALTAFLKNILTICNFA
ncbi:7312_t:CDS:1, partial [Funneliformis caledonium]